MYIYIYIYYVYIYIYMLFVRGGIPRPAGSLPESLSRRTLANLSGEIGRSSGAAPP